MAAAAVCVSALAFAEEMKCKKCRTVKDPQEFISKKCFFNNYKRF
jgi:hypothetical protein